MVHFICQFYFKSIYCHETLSNNSSYDVGSNVTYCILLIILVAKLCRQKLATVMVKLKFAKHLKEAVTYIEQGHVRVGSETVTDPAFLVTRNMEDFITWADTSKIKKKV